MAKEETTGAASESAAPSEPVEVVEVEIAEEVVPGIVSHVRLDALNASTSLIGAANVGELEVSTSIVGGASVSGDMDVSTSLVGIVATKGNIDFRQGWVNNIWSTGDVSLSQGGNALIVGKSASLENAGSAAVVTGSAKVSRGWVGLLLAGKTEMSEDSRVIVDTRAALIIAAALLGGFALVALALVWGSGKVAKQWNPKALGEWAKHKIPADWSQHKMPADWSKIRLPAEVMERIERIRKAAAA